MGMFDRRQRFVTWIAAGRVIIACTLCAAAVANAQELVTNGDFSNGLTGWGQTNFGSPGGQFGINANGPTDTSAASGNYAYAGGAQYNLLTQDVTVTTGSAYRLSFLAGSKSGQGSAVGILSLFEPGNPTFYNAASFDYGPSDAVFGNYTVDFVAGATPIGVWLRSDAGTYAAYDSVSVTQIASVVNAMNYSSASGYSVISSALTGSGKVTVGAGTGGLTLTGANTHTGGTEVTGGTLFVTGTGTLGAASGNVTVSGGGILDLRNQQTCTGTIAMTWQDARLISGDPSNPGSLVNNGVFQFGGGLVSVPVSGSGSFNVTGGGSIDSSNSYTGPTTISVTTGWYGSNQLFVGNANALGAASGDLTISGGSVNLQNNTITRSGNVSISGGSLQTGTVSKSGSDYNIQGGSVGAVLAGTAGLTKSGSATADLGGTNTYSGSTTVNGGTLSVSSAGGLGNAAGAVTVNPGATLYTAGGLTISRTGDVTVNGGNLTSDNNNLGTMSVSGGNFIANNAAVLAVRLAGTAGLTVGGSGETYLWTDSSYTGATVISSGQLTLGGAGAISNQSRLQIASGAAVNLTGAFAPDTINRTFAGLTGAGVLYGGGGTVTVNKTSGTDTFSGDIQGAQGFIKAGSGILILAGNSSYSGATAVDQGGLLVNGTNSGVGAVTVASGAWIGGDGSLAGGLALAVQAKFIFNSAATLDVAGAVSLDNAFSVDSLVKSDGSAIDWGSIADGTYTLINTTSTFNNISNFGAANAADIGGGRTAYFQNGSLQLVVVPEPGAFGLASLGIAAAAWAFRRRK